MSEEIAAPPDFTAWGPFVGHDYKVLRVTRLDIILAGTAFGLANIFAISAAVIAVRQTKACRRPSRSSYIWMIWLELLASVALAILCLLYLLRVVRPSFYFFMAVLLCWAIQIQLLLQIIVNRIRIIMQDQARGRKLVILAAVGVSLINISVLIIWTPARLQISQRWIQINVVWDRIEKVLYLLLDIYLNVYFIRVVNANLVDNGLRKYTRLVRFNKLIIAISLLMDVMIIAAMSVPNGFVYAMFHPLAYLVKLNIEMSMAHLIKAIALGSRRSVADPSLLLTFASSPESAMFDGDLLFADAPWSRHKFLRGLFGRDRHHEIVNKQPEGSFVRSNSMSEYELHSRKRTENTASGIMIGSNEHIHGARKGPSGRFGDPGVTSGAESKETIVPPRPVHLPYRWSCPG